MTLHVEETGSGDPLLLMPGLTQGIEDLRGVRDDLGRHYHVIAADLPGSGRSEPIPRRYTARYYEEDVRTMAALLADRGIASAVVAGHSDGGEVALLMAARSPTLVRAVVAWGAAGALPKTLGPTIDVMATIVEDRPDSGLAKAIVARYGFENARAMMTSWSTAARDLLDAGGDISLGSAEAIRCPVLLIVGEKDVFAPAEYVQRFASRLSDATTVIVPDAGHMVHQQRAEWFSATVLDWLASRGTLSAGTSKGR